MNSKKDENELISFQREKLCGNNCAFKTTFEIAFEIATQIAKTRY